MLPDISYNTIIAEIIGIDDKNIKFTGEFLKSKVTKDIKHTIIESELTYNPSRCKHCKTRKDSYNIVKSYNNNIVRLFERTIFKFRSFRNLRLRILLRKNIKIVQLNSIKDIQIS